MIARVDGLRYSIQAHFWSRRRSVLRDVSLTVEAGEIFGFLGHNGAGKTTTIKSMLGLLRPDAGTISLFGTAPMQAATRRRVGYMPEQAYFPDHLSAAELLLLHGMLAGLSYREARARRAALLDRVGLAKAAKDALRTYSKGMLQRASLAQALIADPDLVILDEPMSGLDPIGRHDVREIMLDLKARGKTVFFSTHILPDVEMICDRAAIIVAGATRRVGPLRELLGEAIVGVEVLCETCPPSLRDQATQLATRTAERPDGVVFELSDVPTANRLIDLLRSHGVQVHGMQVHRRSLEDIFLHEMEVG